MTGKDLLKEIGSIDADLIDEAMKEADTAGNGKRRRVLSVSGILAASVLIFAGIGIMWKVNNDAVRRETDPAGDTKISAENETAIFHTTDMVLFNGNVYYFSGETGVKGELIGTGQDTGYGTSDYAGCPVYLLEGHKGTLRIVIEKDGRDCVFYLWEYGHEQDMADYFGLYGIEEVSDIVSVKLSRNLNDKGLYDNETTVTDRERLAQLYDILKSLKLDRDEYQSRLDRISREDYERWAAEGHGTEQHISSDGEVYVTVGYRGTTAFENSIRIVICTGDGEEWEMSYFPKLGYMNYFAATGELTDWLGQATQE